MNFPSSPVLRLPRNLKGRSLLVGDVHGQFSGLRAALERVGFNPDAGDRLISVGDLVDRGPESDAAIDWLAYPWFFPVRGNHEDMAIRWPAGGMGLRNYLGNAGVPGTSQTRARCNWKLPPRWNSCRWRLNWKRRAGLSRGRSRGLPGCRLAGVHSRPGESGPVKQPPPQPAGVHAVVARARAVLRSVRRGWRSCRGGRPHATRAARRAWERVFHRYRWLDGRPALRLRVLPTRRRNPATGVWASVVPRGGRRLTGQQFPQLSCKIFAA